MNYFNGEKVSGDCINHINYWGDVEKKNGFESTWSIFGDELAADSNHGLGPNAKVRYCGFWDDKVSIVSVDGDTILDLWAAADKALNDVQEGQHRFIEAFSVNERSGEDNVWDLMTGS